MKSLIRSRLLQFIVVFGGLMLTSALGQEAAEASNDWALVAAAFSAAIVVLAAGLSISRFTVAAAKSTARQPEAAADIRTTINLPLFLLEGVTIIAEVILLLIVLL